MKADQEAKGASLALGKKRIDNYLVEQMILLKGEIEAAINADRCQESMLEMARREGRVVAPELYAAAIDSADELLPAVEEAAGALRSFRARSTELRRILADEAGRE